MGKSVEQDSSSTEQLNFETMVRKPVNQSITIQNTEDKEWAINPTISTERDDSKGYFIGKSTLIVPPKSSGQYEVTYHPKAMTKLMKLKKEGEEEETTPETEEEN